MFTRPARYSVVFTVMPLCASGSPGPRLYGEDLSPRLGPARDGSGYRRYDADSVVDLIRIKTLSGAGVPLARIEELLNAEPEQFAEAIAQIDESVTAPLGGASLVLWVRDSCLRWDVDTDSNGVNVGGRLYVADCWAITKPGTAWQYTFQTAAGHAVAARGDLGVLALSVKREPQHVASGGAVGILFIHGREDVKESSVMGRAGHSPAGSGINRYAGWSPSGSSLGGAAPGRKFGIRRWSVVDSTAPVAQSRREGKAIDNIAELQRHGRRLRRP